MSTPHIDPNKYQVFLCASPAAIWIGCFAHTWFVVNEMGTVSRWEIFHVPDRPICADGRAKGTYHSWGYLHRDYQNPFEGIGVFVGSEKYRWPGCIMSKIEGDASSVAAHMAACINASPETYPFCHFYRFVGPNSNTYTQWVLDQFPTCNMREPWNAAGKGYNYQQHTLSLDTGHTK